MVDFGCCLSCFIQAILSDGCCCCCVAYSYCTTWSSRETPPTSAGGDLASMHASRWPANIVHAADHHAWLTGLGSGPASGPRGMAAVKTLQVRSSPCRKALQERLARRPKLNGKACCSVLLWCRYLRCFDRPCRKASQPYPGNSRPQSHAYHCVCACVG
jgi:hypothetical protein